MAVTANYETVMIVSMKKGEEGIQAIVEKFKALIEKHATLKNVEWSVVADIIRRRVERTARIERVRIRVDIESA